MFAYKTEKFKPLLESSEGVHFTSYIENKNDIHDMKYQLDESINLAKEYLSDIMSDEDIDGFISPIEALRNKTDTLKKLNKNLALFRTKNSFRVMNVPVPVDTFTVVANSFHVKPLIKWMQTDREFLLLGLDDQFIHFYKGTLHTIEKWEQIPYPESILESLPEGGFKNIKDSKTRSSKIQETMEWVCDRVLDITFQTPAKVHLVAEQMFLNALQNIRNSKYLFEKKPIATEFNQHIILDVLNEIRSRIRKETRKEFQKQLVEFYYAEVLKTSKKNIYEIAKAAIQGKVKKLLVAEGVRIFGKLNKKTGDISLHPNQIDHEDDDILDDLAQEVLARNGKVIVANKNDIPNERTVLALVEDDLELRNYDTDKIISEVHKERLYDNRMSL